MVGLIDPVRTVDVVFGDGDGGAVAVIADVIVVDGDGGFDFVEYGFGESGVFWVAVDTIVLDVDDGAGEVTDVVVPF